MKILIWISLIGLTSYSILMKLFSETSQFAWNWLLHRACLFVCHYWQWPILIKCVKCYCLCDIRWLMRPILGLNCLLQMEQHRSEEESSVGDALALAFYCTCFCSASLIVLLRIHQYPFLCGLTTLFDPVLWGCPYIASSHHHGSVFSLVLLRGFSLENVYQAF